jgi:hypothetical protein
MLRAHTSVAGVRVADRLQTDWPALTFTSWLAWQTFADLLDPPENPYVCDPVG